MQIYRHITQTDWSRSTACRDTERNTKNEHEYRHDTGKLKHKIIDTQNTKKLQKITYRHIDTQTHKRTDANRNRSLKAHRLTG